MTRNEATLAAAAALIAGEQRRAARSSPQQQEVRSVAAAPPVAVTATRVAVVREVPVEVVPVEVPVVKAPVVKVPVEEKKQVPVEMPVEEEKKAVVRDDAIVMLPEDLTSATAAFLAPMELSGDPTIVQHITSTLDPIVSEHRRLFSLVTKGIHCLVVRTPTEEISEDDELRRRAIDVHMYVTPNLKSVVWRSMHTGSLHSVPISEVTGIVCLNVHHVLPRTYQNYSFVGRSDPVLRIMVSQSTSHWDCLMPGDQEFQDWLSGISLAYGMQTVSVEGKRGGGVADDDEDDGMTSM